MSNETLHKKNYVQYRWQPEQERFDRQANLNQRLNVIITVLSLLAIVGALVFGTFFPLMQAFLFALALVTIATNVLYDFRDHARRYRSIADALRREREMYDANAGIYANPDKAFSRFMQRSEAIIQSGGDRFLPLMVDVTEEETSETSEAKTAPNNPFGSGTRPTPGGASSSSSLRSRLSSSRFTTSPGKNDDDDNGEDSSSRSRFGSSSPFGSRSDSPFSSGRANNPFSNRPANSPFGSSARFSGGRPIGSSGGMRREGNDDPALAGIQTGNGNTGIRFSVYYPKELLPQQWHPLKAYAYMGYAVDAVAVDAEGGDPDKLPEILYDRNRQTRYHIPEGAQVTVTPRMKGFQFNPQSVNIGFYRTWHRFDFEIRAVDARLDEATNGYLTFTVDGLVVADVPLSVYVARGLDRDHKDIIRRVTRKPYRNVYASFSDEDIHLASRLQRVYAALGMYNMRDLMQQRYENGWQEEMLKAIDEAEIFQLFWSDAAAESDSVQRELERAHTHTDSIEDFMRVVYWEQPPTALPATLSHLNAEYMPDIAE